MAGEKIKMNLSIDGNKLSISIAPEKEEIYRRAVAEINGYISSMREKYQDQFSEHKYLSLAALKFAIDKLDLMRSREVGDEDMQALKSLDERLDSYLNALGGTE